jgi:hypothetical protein
VNANPLTCAHIRTEYLKVKLNALNMHVHCLNKLYIAINNSNIASIKRYTVQLKHIAHGRSFFIFGFSRTIQGGTSLWNCIYARACVEVHVHFKTPTQRPLITCRVKVILILILMNMYMCVYVYMM